MSVSLEFELRSWPLFMNLEGSICRMIG